MKSFHRQKPGHLQRIESQNAFEMHDGGGGGGIGREKTMARCLRISKKKLSPTRNLIAGQRVAQVL